MISSIDQIMKSIEELPSSEQDRIRRWLDEKEVSNGKTNGSQGLANRSANSLRWLHENREKYAGLWVALDGDCLIASGSSAKEVYSKAKAAGIKIPFVELVIGQESMPFTGGWLL
jgi:hypothetical protein